MKGNDEPQFKARSGRQARFSQIRGRTETTPEPNHQDASQQRRPSHDHGAPAAGAWRSRKANPRPAAQDRLRWLAQPSQKNAMAAPTMAITDRKSTRLNSSHIPLSRMPSSA